MAQLRAKQIKLQNAGDILIGGTGGNGSVLAVGTNNQVLKIIAGGLAYADNTANDIVFTPGGTIAATTVQGAIAEVATDAATALSGATTALQGELDATQTGAGLSTTGAYVADAATEYLKTATSLADADKKLDAKLKDVAALAGAGTAGVQAEIDVIETAVGLNADGTYTQVANTNYLGGTTTVKASLAALDTALKAADTAYKAADAQEVTDRNAAITAATSSEVTARDAAIKVEHDRAVAAEGALDTAYKAADTTLTNDLAAEVTRATGAETALGTRVDDESSARTSADSAIKTGAGLAGDGSYAANASGHYIAGATSLNNADVLLDTALDTLKTRVDNLGTGSLTAVQAELDAVEASVGLAADGTLVPFATGGYAAGKTTHQAAIEAVDAQVVVNTAGLVAANTRIDSLGAAFNYVGVLAGGGTAGAAYQLNSLPAGGKDAGDYYKVTTAGYFKLGAAAAFFVNAGDGLVWNTTGGVDVIDNTNATVLAGANIAVTGSADTGFAVALDGIVPTANGGTGKAALESVTSANGAITLGAGAAGSVVNAFAITFNAGAVNFSDLAQTGAPGAAADGKFLKWNNTTKTIEYVTPAGLGVTVRGEQDFAPATAANAVVTLDHTPSGEVAVFINGVKLKKAGYTVSAATVTLVDSANGYGIESGDTLAVSYSYAA